MNSLLISVLPLLVATGPPDTQTLAPAAAAQNIRKNIAVIAQKSDGQLVVSPDTIEVDAGTTVTVTIADIDGYSIHATVVDAAGGAIEDWDRQPHAARHTFPDVSEVVYSSVIAVSDTDPADVIYGPVVVVKPKG